MGPQKLRWPRTPRSLNPSLLIWLSEQFKFETPEVDSYELWCGAPAAPPSRGACLAGSSCRAARSLRNMLSHPLSVTQYFKGAIIIILYTNKRRRQDCKIYRGIALLCVVAKDFARVLLPRLQLSSQTRSCRRVNVVSVYCARPLTRSRCSGKMHRATTSSTWRS